jgi:hypothetical protein
MAITVEHGPMVGSYARPLARSAAVQSYADQALPFVNMFLQQKYGANESEKQRDWQGGESALQRAWQSQESLQDRGQQDKQLALQAMMQQYGAQAQANMIMMQQRAPTRNLGRVGRIITDPVARQQIFGGGYMHSGNMGSINYQSILNMAPNQ